MEQHEFDDPDITEELVERQLDLWNARLQAERERQKHTPRRTCRFVTIARDEGTLGNEIARELSRRLGYHVFDKEIVGYIARNSHVRENLVRQLDERSQSLVDDAIERILRMPEYGSFGSEEYRESLIKTLIYLARHGSAILIGRGANFALLDDAGGLRVRVTASPEVRLQRLEVIWNLNREQARRRMHADDEERRKFIRQHFRQDFDDVRFYDLVFNTDRISVERIVSSIESAIDLSGDGSHLVLDSGIEHDG